MSEVITGVVKLTFGIISNKVRDYGAEKLEDGGLVDQKFRGWIVRELDDLKSQLDALSRKDLCTSISFLQQGIDRLSMSLGESSESGNLLTSVFNFPSRLRRSLNAASGSTKARPSQQSVTVEDAVSLANAIGKLRVVSNERFELAKRSFEEASGKANEAFHNTALSTEERILATKVRVASGILQHLDDPEIAASDCLQCLRELHDVPAIQEIFYVHRKGGMKSVFKKETRSEIVETVTLINLILADFITKFTKRRMPVFDWPVIKSGKRVVHPIHHDQTSLPNLKEMKITPPWVIVVPEEKMYHKQSLSQNINSLTSNGDLVCFADGRRGLQKLDSATGKLQPYSHSGLNDNAKHPQPKGSEVIDIAVDEDDAVYVLSGNRYAGYALSVYSEDGKNLHRHSLAFLNGLDCYNITVTWDKNIVICCKPGGKNITVYLCNSDGELLSSFDSGLRKNDHVIKSVYFPRKNEMMLVTKKFAIANVFQDSYMLYIFGKEGKLQKTVKFYPSEGRESYDSLLYNEVTKNIVGQFKDCDDHKIVIEHLSDQTAERQCSYFLYDTNFPKNIFAWGWDFHLVSHANGALALVLEDHVIFLQNPSR